MATPRALEDRRRQARACIEEHAAALARRAGVRVELFDLLADGEEGPASWEARQVRTLEDVAAFLAALATPQGAPMGQGGIK
jgi:hypothetical protein